MLSLLSGCPLSKDTNRILVKKLRNLQGGGHQKITLDYRGEGGWSLGRLKKDYVIFEWSQKTVWQTDKHMKLLILLKIGLG